MPSELSPIYDVAKNGPGGLLKLAADEHPSRLIRIVARLDGALGLSNSLYSNERKRYFGSESIVDDTALPKPAPLSWLMRQAITFDTAASSAREEKARKKYLNGDVDHGVVADNLAFRVQYSTEPGVKAEYMLKDVFRFQIPSNLGTASPSLEPNQVARDRRPGAAMAGTINVNPVAMASLMGLGLDAPLAYVVSRREADPVTPKFVAPPVSQKVHSVSGETLAKARIPSNWQAALTTVNGVENSPVLRTDPQKFESIELLKLRSHLMKAGLNDVQIIQSKTGENEGRYYLAIPKAPGEDATKAILDKVLAAVEKGVLSNDAASPKRHRPSL